MEKYTNPIILCSEKGNTSDPYVVRYDGYYYHCYSNRNGVYITKSETLWDLANGETLHVFDCRGEEKLVSWYAPELHHINGNWYIYAAPDYGKNLHVMTVLRCSGDSPMGEYENMGMMKGLENQWTIDGTVLQSDGRWYFVWTNCQAIYIAEMADPCSVMEKATVLTKPEYAFELQGGGINEGPAVLYKGNKIHIVYSASNSKCDDYCLGLLTFEVGGDILDGRNWKKSPTAVFEKANGIYGPGHCSFTTVTENGNEVDYIVYHGNLVSGTGWYGRSVFAQPFGWIEDMPVFGKPQL